MWPLKEDRNIRLFVDADGRLTDLLSRLNIEIKQRRTQAISANALAHAIETFGSEQAARRWLSIECGALNNRTSLQVIQGERGVTEVDRILSCIDHGIFA